MNVQGKVINKSGQGEPYVKVFPSTLEGKPLSNTVGSITDLNGKFTLSIPESLDAKYINAKSLYGNSVQKLSPNQTFYEINIEFRQSQDLPEIEVIGQSLSKQCRDKGGVWDEIEKKCKTQPKIKTKKYNWRKTLIIGGVAIVLVSVASYFIIKKINK